MRRLLLFDIDGTLVWGGPAKDVFHLALVETFGTAGDIEVHSFAGKTDPQIARELLRGAGLSDDDIDRGLPDLWRRYIQGLEAELVERPMDVLPGVPELLEALADHADVALALLTGNIVDGARLKLGSAGLFHHFTMGSYGSDSENRDELPAVALERARELWGVDFPVEEVIVVGDTPRDVQCGRAVGTRTLGVATGHFDVDALVESGADRVVADFGDTGAVLELLVG
jgi:phosphoglycolate phosphatase-like HAD superfamily hydrolase